MGHFRFKNGQSFGKWDFFEWFSNTVQYLNYISWLEKLSVAGSPSIEGNSRFLMDNPNIKTWMSLLVEYSKVLAPTLSLLTTQAHSQFWFGLQQHQNNCRKSLSNQDQVHNAVLVEVNCLLTYFFSPLILPSLKIWRFCFQTHTHKFWTISRFWVGRKVFAFSWPWKNGLKLIIVYRNQSANKPNMGMKTDPWSKSIIMALVQIQHMLFNLSRLF